MKLLAALVLVGVALPGGGRGQSNAGALVFVADLQGRLVAPAAVETAATAKATGVLIGNQFTVHGSFTGLSSGLRDLAAKPNDPGVHLHQGAVGLTSRYFHGLQVKLNADERSGIFYGAATLTDEQKKALLATEAYIDVHTVSLGRASCAISGGRSIRPPRPGCSPRSARRLHQRRGAATKVARVDGFDWAANHPGVAIFHRLWITSWQIPQL